MGKKVDLNARRNNNNNHIKSNRNFYHNNLLEDTIEQENEENNSQIGQSISQSKREYDLPKNANLTIKLPIQVKTTVTIFIIGAILIFLMIFIVLFGDETAGNGYLALAGKCPTITVINTDCDDNGENCTNKYDGDIVFEDYIAGVVAADNGVNSNNLEYYKTIAIAARTYFYNNYPNDCEVEGNVNFQKYIDIEESNSKEIIIKAIEETHGQAMIKEEIIVTGDYSNACVVKDDVQYYYVRYGSLTYEATRIQKISKEWDSTSAFSGSLEKYYSMLDKTEPDEFSRECPGNNYDYGMSKIGALYLITEHNYTHKDTLKYYYGEDIEIKNINVSNGKMINGFINPVNNASCTSSFGCRNHPIKNEYESHTGLDLGATAGEPIYATKSGKIVSVTKSVPGYSEIYSYGNNILIDHGDNTRTRYAHMLYGSIPDNIKVGATVEQGEIIGQVGSTGTSNGNHLHYEVYVNGKLQNPVDYLDLTNIGNSNSCNAYADVSLTSCGL